MKNHIWKMKHLRGMVAVALVLTLAGGGTLLAGCSDGQGDKAPSLQVQEKVVSATVTDGPMEQVLGSYGTLEGKTSEEISLVSGILVKNYAVNSGDHVEEGDVIACVDPASVKNAIAKLQGVLDQLDEELSVADALTLESKVTSSVSGRVKEIYISSGKSVLDVMAEHGALILLSLDGKMAVDITPTCQVAVGDSLKVKTAGGSVYSGKVEAIDREEATVTITDNGPKNGESVKVLANDGTEIGEGTLYIHNQQAITGYSGTISTVKVSANSTVSAGATLFTLKDTEYTARLDALVSRRNELEKQMQQLFQIYQSGEIRAESAGMVGDCNEEVLKLSVSNPAGGIISLSMEMPEVSAEAEAPAVVESPAESVQETQESSEPQETQESQDASQTDETIPTEDLEETAAESESSTEGPELRECEALVQSIEGRVVRVMVSGQEASLTIPEEVPIYALEKDGKRMSVEELKPGDLLVCTFEGQEQLLWIVCKPADGETEETDAREENQRPGGFSHGTGSGSSAAMNKALAEEADVEEAARASVKETYSLPETTLCTVTPDDRMMLVMSVDELDIHNIQVGQQAEVTLDAFVGRKFEGIVENVDINGTTDSGNTRYAVTVSIPRSEEMLVGMNAAVNITLDRKENTRTIPAAALQEDGNRIYVYTAYDEKTDTLSGEVEVTTGWADGTNVEICEGPEDDTVVYYRYADRLIVR